MISSVIFGIGFLALSQASVFGRDSLTSRIINGEDAKLGEISYQVSLQRVDGNYHFCGGSILNEYYVITGAHCVTESFKENFTVIAGTLKLSEPKSTHDVENIIIHEKYNAADSWKNDIALIRVKTPFVLSDEIGMISLPKAHQVIAANQKAVISGWGVSEIGSPKTDHLQRADVVIADQDFCARAYEPEPVHIYDSQICAYDPNVGKGPCAGDSGGPLTVDGKLVGIISWSNSCGDVNFPTVLTRVPEFIDWIKTNAV